MIEVFGSTDTGRARNHNEDSLVVFSLEDGARSDFERAIVMPEHSRGVLFMVADGMGGAASGEVASAMAVDEVVRVLGEHWGITQRSSIDARYIADTMRRATEIANSRIHQFAVEHSDHQGMGTTATIAAVFGRTLYISQIGDSRAYLVRRDKVYQLTRDQSLMQRLVDAGELTQEQAEQSERRNIILQALGPEPTVLTDISTQELRDGDVLLLCSDGLSGQVRESDILEVVQTHSGMKEVCEELVKLANESGGPDNITAVAARFYGGDLPRPEEADEAGYSPVLRATGEPPLFSLDELIQRTSTELSEEPVTFIDPPSGQPVGESPYETPGKPTERGDDLHPYFIYGILIATVLGLAIILYRRSL